MNSNSTIGTIRLSDFENLLNALETLPGIENIPAPALVQHLRKVYGLTEPTPPPRLEAPKNGGYYAT